jgi:hypothetical protein
MIELLASEQPKVVEVYGTFFKLSLLERIRVLIVGYAQYALTLLLCIISVILIFKDRKSIMHSTRDFYYIVSIVFLFSFISFLVSAYLWVNTVHRILNYISLFAAFLIGSFMSKLSQRNKIFLLTTILIFLLISTLQIYPCQPLIPKRPTLYGEYYVQERRFINTIYHRSLAEFIDSYDDQLSIASDGILLSQMYGFLSSSKQKLISNENILNEETLQSNLIALSPSTDANIIIYSYAEKYLNMFMNLTETKSIMYTNGKSYVLLNF